MIWAHARPWWRRRASQPFDPPVRPGHGHVSHGRTGVHSHLAAQPWWCYPPHLPHPHHCHAPPDHTPASRLKALHRLNALHPTTQPPSASTHPRLQKLMIGQSVVKFSKCCNPGEKKFERQRPIWAATHTPFVSTTIPHPFHARSLYRTRPFQRPTVARTPHTAAPACW